MAERRSAAGLLLGPAAGSRRAGVTLIEVLAGVLSVGWLLASGIYVLRLPPGESGLDSLRLLMTLIAVVLPVALILVAAAAARSARIVREESRRLQAAIDAMRQTYIANRQAQSAGVPVAAGTSPRSAGASPPRSSARPAQSAAEQPRLALGEASAEVSLDRAELIRALNFPDTDRDAAGFAALRRALTDRSARVLIQASQDVLTLLSQDGLYMDDLRPDRARPEIWRRFARGERGRAVAGLGGVRDREALALTAARMREDTIFRDAAHHFLRLFDRMLHGLEPEASDEDLALLSETRTARAFMLLGRVAGTFD